MRDAAADVQGRTFLAALRGLRSWRRGEERAPHKPLLLLWMLGRVQRGTGARLVPFAEAERPLRELLAAYGPPRRSHHPEYPFWHLQADGIWEVAGADRVRARASDADPPVSELRAQDVRAGFPEPLVEALRARPALVRRAARWLLDAHFPESLHADLLAATGLELGATARPEGQRRDPEFRTEVMRAYEYRCAVCGFDGALDGRVVALEAAHIRWHSHEGPSVVENGLCLCPLHHKALDLGIMGIVGDRRIALSARVHGGDTVRELLLRYHGERLREPQSRYAPPANAFVGWHTRQVFKAPARHP